MAAIAPNARAILLLLFAWTTGAMADQAHDVLQVVNRVTTALTANDPAEAMAAFDKSFVDYETLSTYFSNLTSSYAITNEADVVDETDTDSETKLTLDWTLTLENEQSGQSRQRREQVHLRLLRKGNSWKIVELTPLKLFDPQVGK
jgi:hypothetical protein